MAKSEECPIVLPILLIISISHIAHRVSNDKVDWDAIFRLHKNNTVMIITRHQQIDGH